jgi:hypothetical protein
MKPLKSYSEHTFYCLDPNREIPAETPEWIKTKIMESKEWKSGTVDKDDTEIEPDAEYALAPHNHQDDEANLPVEETEIEPF